MNLEYDGPRSGFWNSREVKRLIANAANGKWEIPSSVESLQSLYNEMVRNHNENEFPRCSYCLFIFVDLLKLYGAKTTKRWGVEWWKEPVRLLRDDDLSLSFLKLLKQLLAVDRDLAQMALRRIATKGLPYKMPGGHQSKYRSSDFGLKFLIDLTGKIDSVLTKLRKEETQRAKVIDMDARGRMPLVIFDWIGVDRIALLYKKKKIGLTPLQSKLVHRLLLEKGAVRYESLWVHLYPKDRYESPDSGPPETLKTHKKVVNKRLKEAWGSPPNGEGWIETQKHTGYYLNQSVKWQHSKGTREKTPEFFYPSRVIDNASKRDDDD